MDDAAKKKGRLLETDLGDGAIVAVELKKTLERGARSVTGDIETVSEMAHKTIAEHNERAK